MICKAVLAPESATVASVNDQGDVTIEWDVVREESTFLPPTFEMDVLKPAVST